MMDKHQHGMPPAEHIFATTEGSRRIIVIAVIVVLLTGLTLPLSGFMRVDGTLRTVATPASFPPPGWRPWMGAPAGVHYVHPMSCAGCHPTEAAAQRQTPMAHGAEDIRTTTILNQHPHLQIKNGPWTVRIDRQGSSSIYSATDGVHSLSVPLLTAFGLGSAGQTYIYQLNGTYFESRFSFYNDIQGLDLTIGADARPPSNVREALGRPMSQDSQRQCFGCHTSDDIQNGKLNPADMIPGVSCQNCHGPGSEHVAAMQAHQYSQPHIVNPARMDPGTISDFCGSCHRSTLTVMTLGITSVANVRFQPYRLEMSRCWDPTDARISCLACHDPHLNLVTKTATYDSKCMACHVTRGHRTTVTRQGPACPRAASNCVSCHMPRVEIPGSHFKFTDHNIRIVRPGAPYPD